jgi:protein ImuB
VPACLSALVLINPRQQIVAVCEQAARAGIFPGMTLTQARAIQADVMHLNHVPHRDLQALESLARRMMRFTPVVSLDLVPDDTEDEPRARKPWIDSNRHPRHAGARVARFAQGERVLHDQPAASSTAPPLASMPAGIALDLTGCERSGGGIEAIVARIDDSLRRFRISATICVAPTLGGAWAKTCDPTNHRCIVDSSALLTMLDRLPPGALRISSRIAAGLHHVGVQTIAQLRRLPREDLPARFGPTLLRRLDQALGMLAEPVIALEPFSPIVQRVDFDGAIDSLEAVWHTLGQLLPKLCEELRRRGRGARALDIDLLRPHGEPVRQSIDLAGATRDAKSLFNLIRCSIETDAATLGLRAGRRRRKRHRVSDPAPRNKPFRDVNDMPLKYVDDGYVGVRVEVTRSEPLTETQQQLIADESESSGEELSRLVERLCVRLGRSTIARLRCAESYLPEKSWQAEDALSSEKRAVRPAARRTIDLPLALLPTPKPARVIVTPSHDLDGRPVWIDFAGKSRSITHAAGPVRIAGQWWHGHHRTRDYYDIEDADADRLWIFRVLETGRWFVHGAF